MYPFSTENAQDYKNLMSVYLDSVFFPRLRETDFRQDINLLQKRKGLYFACERRSTIIQQLRVKNGKSPVDRQEGWRLEHENTADQQSPIVFKGVVYNEMKGVFVSWSVVL